MSVRSSVCLSFHSSICLSVHLSVGSSICLPVCLSNFLFYNEFKSSVKIKKRYMVRKLEMLLFDVVSFRRKKALVEILPTVFGHSYSYINPTVKIPRLISLQFVVPLFHNEISTAFLLTCCL
jgi:hypothetical protein